MDAGLRLESLHHRVVQVSLGGEVAVHRALADACPFGDGAECQLPPVPRVEPVGQLGARADDPVAGLGGLLPPRGAVVAAAWILGVTR